MNDEEILTDCKHFLEQRFQITVYNFLIRLYHVIETVFRQYLARGDLNPMSLGVIRNQHPKIHRFRLVSTVGGPLRKISNIDCTVI